MAEKTIQPNNNIAFLVVFMGLIALYDQYLALIEGPLIPYILEDFNVTAEYFALWQGIFGIITFSVFFIGWLSDAYGRKPAMLILILVMGIPAFLILTAYTFFWFMLLYSLVIMGTLSNLWEIPISEESPPKKRGLYGSLAFLIGLLPIWALVGGPLAEGPGWRWGYAIMGFMMIILIVLWLKMNETARWEATHEAHEKKTLKIKEAFKSLEKKDWQYIAMCSIIYGLWTISFKMVATWGGYYYMNIQGLTEPEYRSILLVGGLLMIVGALLSGICMEKLGRNATLIISCVGSVVGFIGLALTGSKYIYWIIFIFMPMTLGWVMVYFAEIFPTRIRSTAVGISATATRLSYVIGPLIAAALLITFPTMEGFWIFAGIFMIIPLFTLFIKPYETKGKDLDTVQLER